MTTLRAWMSLPAVLSLCAASAGAQAPDDDDSGVLTGAQRDRLLRQVQP